MSTICKVMFLLSFYIFISYIWFSYSKKPVKNIRSMVICSKLPSFVFHILFLAMIPVDFLKFLR